MHSDLQRHEKAVAVAEVEEEEGRPLCDQTALTRLQRPSSSEVVGAVGDAPS